MISVNWVPVNFVGIGLNTDFTLAGTFSFGSQRSRWLGPPWRYRRITLLALPKPRPPLALVVVLFAFALASKPRTSARVRPRRERPPTRSKSRRETPPSQLSRPAEPGITSMAEDLARETVA